MALPNFGAGVSLSMQQVNTELGVSPNTTQISLNQSTVRALFQKTTAGSAVSLFDGFGKSNAVMPSITGASYTDNGSTPVTLSHATYSSFSNNTVIEYLYIETGDGFQGNNAYRGFGSLTVIATGGGLSYEWQVADRSGGLSPPSSGAGNGYLARLDNNPSGYSPYFDRVTGVSTNTLSFSNIHQGIQYSNEGSSNTYIGGNNNTGPTYARTYGPTTAYYRVKVSNSVGTVYSPWYGVITRYEEYQNSLGMRGFNCQPCDYDCNCTCGWQTNCCCYDSNGDGISCCDVNDGDVNACCDRPDQCGESYNCYDCSTCTNYCTDNCGSDPCNDNCGYYEEVFETAYNDSSLY